jgi:putative endopeptidase
MQCMNRLWAPLGVCLVLGCTESDGEQLAATGGEMGLGFEKTELLTDIRPQDDFWRWVNGRWLDSTEIPPDWPSYGTTEWLYDHTNAQLLNLIEDAAAGRADQTPSTALVGALFSSFMNEAVVDAGAADGLAGVVAYVEQVRGARDLPHAFAQALRLGVAIPIGLDYEVDIKDATRNLPLLWQSGLGLPDRDYYLDDGEQFASIRAAYAAHIVRLFELAGWENGTQAAQRIVAIEQRIAQMQWSSVANRDIERILGNRFTLAEVERRAPGFDWRAFFVSLGLPAPSAVTLAQDDYFAGLATMLDDVSAEDWRAYLRFKTLKAYARYLGPAIVAENFAFEGRTLQGQQAMQPRVERGVRLVSESLGEPLGRLYVTRYFPPQSKQRIEAMVEHLRAAFGASVDALDWMSVETKASAREKLAKFTSKIGYPSKWRDYGTLELRPDDLVGNVARVRAFDHDHLMYKLSHPVDRNEWGMTPQTPNAYYRASFNEIIFPAAFLQPPLFDPAADDALNYGAIGAVIGHEFSHGFDDQGRKFDGDGALRDWWTQADAAAYERRAQQLIEQYARFEPLPGVPVNGELTLGENIGDLVGVSIAYRAYRASLQGREAPVIDGFTGDQRFFIGYARAWRGKVRPERLRELLSSDPHAPNEYRVRGVLPNLPEFQLAFQVRPGAGMYLAPEAQVRIW